MFRCRLATLIHNVPRANNGVQFRAFCVATTKPVFDKILIANRGEIACRVMKTCKKMGIKTVAIYSEPDSSAVHVRMADEAYCVGPAATSESYLNIPKILEVIKQTGAQAVHPGYGFLSENSKFVETLEQQGVVFIGPKTHAIQAMGDKIESKKLAKKAGVNIIPGFLGEVDNDEDVKRIANEIGYPVMIKASAGGGGKGMRIAWNDEEAIEGFRLSKNEAKSSFGDDRMLIEKFIDNPRHIEIQVLCDGQDGAVYLNERECSIQRRNQKVVEEAPSPFLTPEVRKQMGEQAIALANAVQYRSAGTVEMLVDSKRNFYFLEMNTRLQVEHPITEYITGVDIVEHMIKVAAGQKLSLKQKDIPILGWAIESRVYAEDPYRNFLPSIGTLSTYEEPDTSSGHVRVDSGISEGSEISMFYDPMISKLATFGSNRKEAIENMRIALDSYKIKGVEHNISFLRAVMDNPRFVLGDLTTNFIAEEFPQGFKGYAYSTTQIEQLVCAAAVIRLEDLRRQATISDRLRSAEDSASSQSIVISVLGKDYDVEIESVFDDEEGDARIYFNNTSRVANYDWGYGDPTLVLQVDSQEVIFQILSSNYNSYQLQFCGSKVEVKAQSANQHQLASFMPEVKQIDYSNFVISPMPGKILSIDVQPGDKVHLGQTIAVMEAMKMQNVLRAAKDGVVKSVQCKVGDNVSVDTVLVQFEEQADKN